MDAARLIIFIVALQLLLRKAAVKEQHQHQNIRLLDHIIPVDAVVGPVIIQREIRHRNRVNIYMRQVKKALMLFIEHPVGIVGYVHPIRHLLPGSALTFLISRLLGSAPVSLRRFPLQSFQTLQCVA